MERKLIQSVERAAKILDIVSKYTQGVKLKEVSNVLGLGSSTVFYLISTLVETGFIKQNNGKYQLGSKNLMLGNIYLENMSIYKIALPVIEELLEKINENIDCVLYENDEIYFLIRMESTHSVKPTKLATSVKNAHATALGKLFLSTMPKEKLNDFVKKNCSLEKFTKNTITNLNDLNAELDKIRENRYALDIEGAGTGVNCIAVPIYSHEGKIIASIVASAPSQRFSKDIENQILTLLKNSATLISNELGYNP